MNIFQRMAVLSLFALLLSTPLTGIVSASSPLPQSEDQVYIVQPEDSLSKLAEGFYGDVDAWPEIWIATIDKEAVDGSFAKIKNPHLIEPGQKLWIPDVEEVTPPDSQSSRILFYSYGILLEADGNGKHPRLLLDCPGIGVHCGKLSPDGERIVYYEDSNDEEEGYSLGIMNLKGMQKTELVSGLPKPPPAMGWSFDGQYIAFSAVRQNDSGEDIGEYVPYVYAAELSSGEVYNLAKGGGYFNWSPIENRIIVFDAYKDNRFGLYVVDPDGSDSRTILTGWIGASDWSPDGNRIAVSDQSNILIVDCEGEKLKELKENRYELLNCPKWSPDGKTLLYSGYRMGDGILLMTDLEKDVQTLLVETEGPTWCMNGLLWSPDSRKVLYGVGHYWYIFSIEDGTNAPFLKGIGINPLRWE